ncbi:MAG: maleylpyruvate isomerase N-terminal domain-containing protein [Mycobacterium sp.]
MAEQNEGAAMMVTVEDAAPTAPTACAGWTTHDIVAHLAAGSKEIADLIEEKLAGSSPRPTRDFAGHEAPFRALPDDELRAAWLRQIQRKTEAVSALAALGQDANFEFTRCHAHRHSDRHPLA